MQISIAASIVYLISIVAIMTGFYRLKKSDEALLGGVWIPVTAIMVMGYQALMAAFIHLAHLPVNIISVGVCNLLAASFFWYIIMKDKEHQTYTYERVDVIFWCTLFVVVAVFAIQRYGLNLNIHYNTIDPATHFAMAMDVVNGQGLWAMYYASLHNALLIELLGAFVRAGSYYHIFVLADILHFALAGMMFWGVIRRYLKDNFLKAAGIVTAFVYLFGYPLNSTCFGFVYLGMGITVIAYLIVVTDMFMRQTISKRLSIALMSLGCLSIFQTYVLFMPVVFFAIFFCVLANQMRQRKLISVDTVSTCLAIFLTPTLLGLWYTYGGYFGGGTGGGGDGGGSAVASAIQNEGGIYRDLFSNFVFVIPLAIFGYYNIIKKKKNRLLLYIFPMLLVYLIGMLIMGLEHKVSGYYFYKLYYFLWLLAFVLAFAGIGYIERKTRLLLVLGFGTWCFIAGMYVLDIEGKIQERNLMFCMEAKSQNYLDIYAYNMGFLLTPRYSEEKVELYAYARDEILDKTDEREVPIAGYWEDYYWMEAISNQRTEDYEYWNYGDDCFFEGIEKNDIHYVIVLTDCDFYNSYKAYFDGLDRVYENSAGYIAIINGAK